MSSGYIYIMTNMELPHLVKVGHTSRSVKERARELSSGAGVPGVWKPQKSWMVSDSYKFEKIVHEQLRQYRKGGAELYKLDYNDAINKVSIVLRNAGAIGDDGLSEIAKFFASQEREINQNKLKIDSLTKEISVIAETIKRNLSTINGKNHQIKKLEVDFEKQASKYELLLPLIFCLIIGIFIPFFLYCAPVALIMMIFTDSKAKKEVNLENKIEDLKGEINEKNLSSSQLASKEKSMRIELDHLQNLNAQIYAKKAASTNIPQNTSFYKVEQKASAKTKITLEFVLNELWKNNPAKLTKDSLPCNVNELITLFSESLSKSTIIWGSHNAREEATRRVEKMTGESRKSFNE